MRCISESQRKECCCVPRPVWQLIIRIVQSALFTILSLVFCILFWFADKERQFSQQDCQTDSCLCNDCNQQAWRRWRLEGQGSACHFGYLAMERCWIRFVVRIWRLTMVLLVMGCVFFGRGSRRSEALHVLVLLASMCHFLSHSSDLWPNPRVWMSCLFLDLADTLRLVASLLVVVRCFKLSAGTEPVGSLRELLPHSRSRCRCDGFLASGLARSLALHLHHLRSPHVSAASLLQCRLHCRKHRLSPLVLRYLKC